MMNCCEKIKNLEKCNEEKFIRIAELEQEIDKLNTALVNAHENQPTEYDLASRGYVTMKEARALRKTNQDLRMELSATEEIAYYELKEAREDLATANKELEVYQKAEHKRDTIWNAFVIALIAVLVTTLLGNLAYQMFSFYMPTPQVLLAIGAVGIFGVVAGIVYKKGMDNYDKRV